MGDEAAEDLVNWMQHVDAQRAELRELNELNFSRVESRFAEARAETRADLAALRQELQTDLAGLRHQLDVSLAELREALQSGLGRLETKLEQRTGDLMKWSFVFWVGAVAAIAVLAGVFR